MPIFTKLEADEAEYITEPMHWEKAEEVKIQKHAYYLAKTNGSEWRDLDLYVMKGFMVEFKLRPENVRGRPVWVAKINLPRERSE